MDDVAYLSVSMEQNKSIFTQHLLGEDTTQPQQTTN